MVRINTSANPIPFFSHPTETLTMSKLTDISIKQITTNFTEIEYRTPIKFGGRVVANATLFNVDVDVETNDGRRATGHGSMPMGNAWGWPSEVESGERTLDTMKHLGNHAALLTEQHNQAGHPIEIMHDLQPAFADAATTLTQTLELLEPIPKLAQLVSTSPIDAAVSDAYGKALAMNSYNLLGAEFMNRDLGQFLNGDMSGLFLDQFTLRQPKEKMPLYHLVGALDPLTDEDIATPLNDGVPETLGDWIISDGLTHLKIKLAGDDLHWDVQRVIDIDHVSTIAQQSRGCQQWWYSTDFNEKCKDVQYVLDFLSELQARAPQAFERIQYIEQPTHRDLKKHPSNGMHQAAKIKPVVIDESLIDFESLLLARDQGYSGVALKACKGHGEALIMGAAAQHYNLFLCVQDLTCVGASFLHSASLAARIPTIMAIEGNGRQYCPFGNEPWDTKFPSMFDIREGSVGTHCLTGHGLGY